MSNSHTQPDAVYLNSSASLLKDRHHNTRGHVPRDVSLPQNRLNGQLNASVNGNVGGKAYGGSTPVKGYGYTAGSGSFPGSPTVALGINDHQLSTSSDSSNAPLRSSTTQSAPAATPTAGGALNDAVAPNATVVSKRLLLLGLAFLPLVWVVHILSFAPMVWPNRCRLLGYHPPLKVNWDASQQRVAVKRDIKLALGGVIFWTVAFVAWFTTFLLSRTSWGATGDAISVNIPPGE